MSNPQVVSISTGRAYDGAADRPHAIMNVEIRRFMNVRELAGRLGLGNCAARTAIKRLRLLHDQGGLPEPRSPRFVKGQLITGARAIDARSQWDRAQILGWLETGFAPLPAEAASSAGQAEQLRAKLAARAMAAIPRRRLQA